MSTLTTMLIRSGIDYFGGDGLATSVKAMQTQFSALKYLTDNIANFGIPGYQRQEPIITSFVEFLGPRGVDKRVDTDVGRLRFSKNPMDFAINGQGYFSRMNAAGGIEKSRDGRMRLDKLGNLLTLDGKKVLSSQGQPIQLPFVPSDLEKQLKVDTDGQIQVLNLDTQTWQVAGRIGLVGEKGETLSKVDIRQQYVEDSNVSLQNEFVQIMPLRRYFEANRQLFIIQSDQLSRTIQELGRAQ